VRVVRRQPSCVRRERESVKTHRFRDGAVLVRIDRVKELVNQLDIRGKLLKCRRCDQKTERDSSATAGCETVGEGVEGTPHVKGELPQPDDYTL